MKLDVKTVVLLLSGALNLAGGVLGYIPPLPVLAGYANYCPCPATAPAAE